MWQFFGGFFLYYIFAVILGIVYPIQDFRDRGKMSISYWFFKGDGWHCIWSPMVWGGIIYVKFYL
jgi:hypothetical protein